MVRLLNRLWRDAEARRNRGETIARPHHVPLLRRHWGGGPRRWQTRGRRHDHKDIPRVGRRRRLSRLAPAPREREDHHRGRQAPPPLPATRGTVDPLTCRSREPFDHDPGPQRQPHLLPIAFAVPDLTWPRDAHHHLAGDAMSDPAMARGSLPCYRLSNDPVGWVSPGPARHSGRHVTFRPASRPTARARRAPASPRS